MPIDSDTHSYSYIIAFHTRQFNAHELAISLVLKITA